MNCPECGSETAVTDSRLAGGNIRRRRECKKCGERIFTTELQTSGVRGDYAPTGYTPVRTDAEIVQQTEDLAALLANKFFQSTLLNGNFRDSVHPRGAACWAAACEVQELLTGTDVQNALANLEEEGEEPGMPEGVNNALMNLEMIEAGQDTVTGDSLSVADMRRLAADALRALTGEWE